MKHRTLHIIGSAGLGGAEQFFQRFVTALHEQGKMVGTVLRKQSPLNDILPHEILKFWVPMANGWDVRSTFQIGRNVTSFNADVVQTYMGRATRLTRLGNRRNVVHVARLGGFYKIRGYYEHADAWVGNTKAICDYLVLQGLPSARIFHIGNFVDPIPAPAPEARVLGRSELDLPHDAFVVLGLGRFIAKKGFRDLVEAFDVARARSDRRLVLLLAGEGPERDTLRSMAEEKSLGTDCRILDWRNDPAPYFAVSDLLVCPSREEPLGNVILEGWAYGLPVVSTATAGASELIESGSTGIVVPLESPSALARALESVIRDQDLAANLVENGRNQLAACHSRVKVVDSYLELYDQVRPRSG